MRHVAEAASYRRQCFRRKKEPSEKGRYAARLAEVLSPPETRPAGDIAGLNLVQPAICGDRPGGSIALTPGVNAIVLPPGRLLRNRCRLRRQAVWRR